MTELKGICTDTEIDDVAKFFDSLVDFNELLGDRKVLLVVKLGKLLEKNDRKLFKSVLSYIDDSIINEKVSAGLLEILVTTKEYIIAQHTEELSSYLSSVIAANVSFLSSDEAEEKVIYGALTMLSGLLETLLSTAATKFKEGVKKAETETE